MNNIYQIYTDNIQTVGDITSDKILNIQTELFNKALSDYVQEKYNMNLEEFSINFTILQCSNYDVFTPAKVLIKENTPVSRNITIDLTNYWPEYVFEEQKDDYLDIVQPYYEDNYGIYEIIDINYITGKVTLFNKYLGNKINVPLNKIDLGTVRLSDYLTLNDTFTNMINNK
jgi:hypothetical protein